MIPSVAARTILQMARVANPGGHQRVSAHVLPKARAFHDVDEDEKTTIESGGGWEEEASTTVEQGEVAEKIRALGTDSPQQRGEPGVITSVTSTSNVEELTVDDRRANAALSVITPPTLALPSSTINARLVCTQGNDTGTELEVRPGKSYSIGRGIDNDFVLTDIAVSRKHFDLRIENDAWVLVDRGSGNGTLINGNVEDAPFLLAHGDQIEIGNTTFRFDIPTGIAQPIRARGSALDVDLNDSQVSHVSHDDEEEPSTVAGKPLRNGDPPLDLPPYVPPMRPKTLPPPAPLRARTNSVPPAYPNGTPAALPMQMPPHPNPVPMQHAPMLPPPPMQAPTQHMQAPMQLQPPPMPQSTMPLPQMANRPPPPMSPQMLVEQQPVYMPTTLPGQPPMQPPSRPMPYSYPPPVYLDQLPPHVQPHWSLRHDPNRALVQPTPCGAPVVAASYLAQPGPSSVSRRAKLVLGGIGLTMLAAAATIAIIKHAEAPSEPDATPVVEAAPPKTTAPTPKFEPIAAKTDKTDPPKQNRSGQAAARSCSKQQVKQPDPPKQETVKPPDPPKQQVKQPDPPKQQVKQPDPPKQQPKPPDPPKQQVRQPDPRQAGRSIKQQDKQPPQQRSSVDVSSIKQHANEQYQARQFGPAAATLRNALPQLSTQDQAGLRTTAHEYEAIGAAFASISGSATGAYSALSTAIGYDRGVGGAFTQELQGDLAQVAPKAATLFFSKQQYESAYQAVKTAEAGGNSNSTTKLVRTSLERKANDIYNAAAKDMDTNKDAAKKQLRRIKNMVDASSPIAAKAQELLEGN